MDKQEFLSRLRHGLSGLSPKETEERVSFYSEMIDDRMEEGLSEQEAVHAVGSVDGIIAQILADTPASRARPNTKRPPSGWEIVLLVLGSPIWLSLLIAIFAVIISLYAVLWSVVISLWAVFASLAACAALSVAAGIIVAAGGSFLTGAATFAAGLVCAGLSIFAFYGCAAATKGVLALTKKLAVWLWRRFRKKEEA